MLSRVRPEAFVCLVLACSPEPTAPEIASGAAGIRAHGDRRSLSLHYAGQHRLELELGGIALGVVRELSPALSYDPYWLEASVGPEPAEPPADLLWLSVEALHIDEANGALKGELSFEGGATMDLRIDALDGERFRIRFLPHAPGPIAWIRLWARAGATEAFYGLGSALDGVDHRGKLRPMQMEPDFGLESASNEVHVPVPLLIGTRGWGIFVNSRRPGLFDVARKDPTLVEVTYGTAEDSGEGLEAYLFAAAHPLDVTKRYYATTGFPRVPPPWVYGPWIWRDENRDAEELLDDLRTIRSLDLATSGVWIDRPYASAVNSFDFDTQRFPAPGSMIREARDAGFAVALWHTPYLEESTGALRDEAQRRGFFPPETGLRLNPWSAPIDFTNPEAGAWWSSLVSRYTALGIQGFKLDYAEDVMLGVGGGSSGWRFADGKTERTMHDRYTRLYHEAYAETLPEEGGLLLVRAARFGEQALGPVVWPGDLDASLAKHRELALDRQGTEFRAVGGLPASLVLDLSLGPSGFPLYGADTGGYRHSPPDEETFVRWAQQTALSSVMQVGDSSSQPPWLFTPENGRSERTLAIYRELARLHLRLFPYAWTYVHRVREDGRPISRALGLAHPELGVHPSDTYLFGDALLVAPVVEPRATRRILSLPPGEWVDWWDGTRRAGPGPIEVDAPLEKLPLFLRAGSLVPMLRPTIDTLHAVTSSASIESFANDPGELFVRTARGPASSFTIFDGTELSQSEGPDGLLLSASRGVLFRDAIWFEIPSAPPTREVSGERGTWPRALDLSGLQSMERGYAEVDGTLWVKLPATEDRARVKPR